MWVARVRLLVAVFWAGSLWTVGYLVAPTLFATLHDSVLAGTIVGSLLRTGAYVSFVSAALLLVLLKLAREIDAARARALMLVIAAMLGCALVIHLALQPLMVQLREAAGAGGIKGSSQWSEFAALHGVSQLLYVVESVLAAVLVLRMR